MVSILLLNSKHNHIGFRSASVNMILLLNNTPCPPQHKYILKDFENASPRLNHIIAQRLRTIER